MKILRKSIVMDDIQIRRTLMRIAHEIVESNKGVENLVLVGIRKRGVPLAERISNFIYEFEGVKVPVGALDITLYRDDVHMISSNPLVGRTDIRVDIHRSVVVLVDDVLFTGRTVRAALDELIDFGRPKGIRLAVLIDRGHREFPIRADSVGKNVPTSSHEVVRVFLKETDGEEKVVLNEIASGDGTNEEENKKSEKGKNVKRGAEVKKKKAKPKSKRKKACVKKKSSARSKSVSKAGGKSPERESKLKRKKK